MRIRRLKLSGFKSFVEPSELRIEPGLTGVVGPNGCGKSNLVEALRWVMGETSHKSMRASGMDDVIFSGSGNRPARNTAEVQASMQDFGTIALERPIDVKFGPDGALYILDFGRMENKNGIPRLFPNTGRIFKLMPVPTPTTAPSASGSTTSEAP